MAEETPSNKIGFIPDPHFAQLVSQLRTGRLLYLWESKVIIKGFVWAKTVLKKKWHMLPFWHMDTWILRHSIHVEKPGEQEQQGCLVAGWENKSQFDVLLHYYLLLLLTLSPASSLSKSSFLTCIICHTLAKNVDYFSLFPHILCRASLLPQ